MKSHFVEEIFSFKAFSQKPKLSINIRDRRSISLSTIGLNDTTVFSNSVLSNTPKNSERTS